jgi:hypothetical protein
MVVLAVLTMALLVVAVTAFIAMFRRDDPVLGMVGLVVTVAAAGCAAFYGGVASL